MGVQDGLTSPMAFPGRFVAAALVGLCLSGPVRGEGLEALVGALLAGIQPDGSLDLSRFDCRRAVEASDAVHSCREPVSGLGFLHVRDDEGDAMSVSVDKGPAGPTAAGIAVPDRAAFDRLEAEFRALDGSEALRGLTRCVGPKPGSARSLVVRAMPSGHPVLLGFVGLDASAAADLEDQGKEGAFLSTIVIPVLTGLDCVPVD